MLGLVCQALAGLLIGAGAFLLLAPIRVRWRWSTSERRHVISIHALAGSVYACVIRLGTRRRIRVALLGRPIVRRPSQARPSARAPKRRQTTGELAPHPRDRVAARRKPKAGRRQRDWRAWWRERDLVVGWLRLVPRLLRGLSRALRWRELRLSATVGVGDPAATGWLVGLLWAFSAPVQDWFPHAKLCIHGEWDRVAASSVGRLDAQAWPPSALWTLLSVAARGPWWATLRAVWRSRRSARHERVRMKPTPTRRISNGYTGQ